MNGFGFRDTVSLSCPWGFPTPAGSWVALLVHESYSPAKYANHPTYVVQNIRLLRLSSDGTIVYVNRTLEDPDTSSSNLVGRIHDFSLGNSRLKFGDKAGSRLAAYYKVRHCSFR